MKPKSSCLCITVANTCSVHVCVCCVVHTDHTTRKIPHIQICAAGWREWKVFLVYCCSFARETPASWPVKRKHDRYRLERSTTSFLLPSFLLLPSPPLLILSFLRIDCLMDCNMTPKQFTVPFNAKHLVCFFLADHVVNFS